jgi:DNA repair protein RadC
MYKTTSIKNWIVEEQPREKLKNHGAHVLSTAELIAILIATGTKEESAIEVSKKLVESSDNSINQLAKKELNELMKIKGIGFAKAVSLAAAFELGKRRKTEISNVVFIKSSHDIYTIAQPLIEDLKTEEFWAILLNRGNKIISKKRISHGGVSSTVVDVKILLKYAIDELASAVIVFHNHPSGNSNPSAEDKLITQKIKNALTIVDINLVDHLVVTQDSYFSFADEGLL